jgi:nitrate reductase NapD
MGGQHTLNRRELFLGRQKAVEAEQRYHVSGAVVRVVPRALPALLECLRGMQGVEISAQTNDRVVITIEGESAGALGARLTEINLLDGVIAASMVYEHSESVEELNDEHGSQPA